MISNDSTTRAQMSTNLAEFLELLSATRKRVLASGRGPTEIPEDLKVALIRFLSE